MRNRIIHGDALEVLRTLPDESVNCCVTSPPYFGLRDYGIAGQIGLEDTPEAYINRLVEVFCEAWRVLRSDATLWLNLGDGYRADKQLRGVPWRVAFALQNYGWYLRQDIIWSKPNPMPESVTDRCTKSHEYIFLFSKSPKYYFDSESIKEVATSTDCNVRDRETTKLNNTPGRQRMGGLTVNNYETRNRRSVWVISTQPFKAAHFATFPPELIRPCIRAGCPVGGIVLDPFMGSGTTAVVALEEVRDYIGIELNGEYIAKIAEPRIAATARMGSLFECIGEDGEDDDEEFLRCPRCQSENISFTRIFETPFYCEDCCLEFGHDEQAEATP